MVRWVMACRESRESGWQRMCPRRASCLEVRAYRATQDTAEIQKAPSPPPHTCNKYSVPVSAIHYSPLPSCEHTTNTFVSLPVNCAHPAGCTAGSYTCIDYDAMLIGSDRCVDNLKYFTISS